jgi:hypothetical protein
MGLAVSTRHHIIASMVPHITVSVLLRSARRVVGAILLGLLALAGMGAAVVAQAGREETTRAETVVLMLDGAEDGQAARVDRTVRLYLDGRISRIVLAGSETLPAHETLVARGVLQDKLAEVQVPTQIDQLTAVRQVVQESRMTDLMLIAEPVETLRLLKIARDQGLNFQSAPVGADSAISLRDVVDEVGRYLAYCFVGR